MSTSERRGRWARTGLIDGKQTAAALIYKRPAWPLRRHHVIRPPSKGPKGAGGALLLAGVTFHS